MHDITVLGLNDGDLFEAALTQLEYLTNVPMNVHYTRSQQNSCHIVSMMGLFGKHSYLGTLAKHLPGH
jgi:hypothetical protein